MKIESIAYEERYMNLDNPSEFDVIDSYLIKSDGEIIRKLNGEILTYLNAAKEDFAELEKEILEFIDKADHTTYFIDNMSVSIIITYEDGSKQIVERGLSCEDEFFDSIIESYLDEFTEC